MDTKDLCSITSLTYVIDQYQLQYTVSIKKIALTIKTKLITSPLLLGQFLVDVLSFVLGVQRHLLGLSRLERQSCLK